VRQSALSLCAVLVVLAACGGDDEPLRTVTVSGSQPIRTKADEYRFDPGRIVVTSDRPLRFDVENKGTLAHNLTILDGDRKLAALRSFPPGEQRTLNADVPPGSYRLVCTVSDHEELGMVGELYVKR
jgi:plastocyanin